ncbi:unnamed protein product [Leptosia nina]|uniref:Uncharacterized protein n=1 Tax=Leptosia nina TaxID=320188 RepID=A0AAV1IYQ3_9NEOP
MCARLCQNYPTAPPTKKNAETPIESSRRKSLKDSMGCLVIVSLAFAKILDKLSQVVGATSFNCPLVLSIGPRSGILNLAGATARQGPPGKRRLHYHSLLWGKCLDHTRTTTTHSFRPNLRLLIHCVRCHLFAERPQCALPQNWVRGNGKGNGNASPDSRATETDIQKQVRRRRECIALTHRDRLRAFVFFVDAAPAAFVQSQ